LTSAGIELKLSVMTARRTFLIAAGSAAVLAPLASSLPASAAYDGANPQAPRQFRALWIATVQRLDWPTAGTIAAMQAEYLAILDYAVATRMNAVVVQVRPTADSFWPNALEPWSRYLSGTAGLDPGWDPLEFLVAEAHARNLEFHAWFNPYRISMPTSATEAGADLTKLPAAHPARNRPDWTVAYPVNNAGGRLYYNPGVPDVRQFVQEAVLDAVTKYDIDGVHFDDYFYPYPAAGQDFGDAATFAQYGQGWASKADWRRHNIDLLIQEMALVIKRTKPWVKFGVSPFGIWRNKAADPLGSETNGTQSYEANFADTRKWVKEQRIDYIVPQIYWHIGLPVADYAKLVPWWASVADGTRVHLYIGQANYKVAAPGQPAPWSDPAELSRHLTFNKDYPQVGGDVHFRAKIVMGDPIGSTSRFVTDHYAQPALVPAMPHLPAKPLHHPIIKGKRGDSLVLRETAQGNPWGEVTSFAVYRNGSLIGTARKTGRDTLFGLTPGDLAIYQATALDRIWNQSPASPPRLC
jgi:uncharacterized lipoprotein YddW (UPF0748 family)